MYTRKQAADFVWQMGEDATRAAATAVVLTATGMAQNILAWDWVTIAGAAGGAAFMSVMFSLGAKNVGVKNTAQYLAAGDGKHLP